MFYHPKTFVLNIQDADLLHIAENPLVSNFATEFVPETAKFYKQLSHELFCQFMI